VETPTQMAEPINMHEAKTHFSRLVERVEAGEEIVIARDGHPVARMVPLRPRTQSREPGLWRGLVRLAPDFDQTDDALLDSFEA
jgi:prevent-host-death family protein